LQSLVRISWFSAILQTRKMEIGFGKEYCFSRGNLAN